MTSRKLCTKVLHIAATLLATLALNHTVQCQEARDTNVASTKSIWRRETTPNPGPNNILFSLSADSESDIWSVGDFVALHFNGKAWKSIPLKVFPAQGESEATMNAVATVSPTDAWAVGDTLENIVPPGNGHFVGVIEHFDGKKWRIVNPQFSGVELHAIRAVSANDIYAVGDSNADGGQPNPFVAHFDGATWSEVVLPQLPNGETGAVRGIAVVSADDIWIAGDAGTVVPTTLFAMHFNGKDWGVVAVPIPAHGQVHDLSFGRGMTAIATNDVWAVGDFAPLSTGLQQTLTEHFDGKAWKVVPSPNAGHPGSTNRLSGIAAVSSKDVWACGQTEDNSIPAFENLIEHWDGTRWTISPVALGNGFAALNAVLAFSTGSVYIAGSDIDINSTLTSVIFHTNQGK